MPIILYPIASLAQEMITYRFDEMEISIQVPDTYEGMYRNMKENDPYLISSGITAKQANEMLIAKNLHLFLYDDENGMMLAVVENKVDYSDWDSIKDEDLLSIGLWYEEALGENGYTELSSEIYRTNELRFLKLCSQLDQDLMGTIHTVHYFTKIHEKIFSIEIASFYDIPVELLQKIVDTVTIGIDS